MSKVKRWHLYWKESLVECQEVNDMIIYLVFIVSVFAALAGKFAGFKIEALDFLAEPFTHKIAIIIAIAMFVWILLLLPFQRHEKEREKHESEIRAKDEIIEKLQTSNENLERIKEREQKLAKHFSMFELRIYEIIRMSADEYSEKSGSLALDSDTNNRINLISSFLKSEYGTIEASLFISASDFLLKKPSESNAVGAEYKKQRTLEYLTHLSGNLKNIIQSQ